jgi:hypothetical protein
VQASLDERGMRIAKEGQAYQADTAGPLGAAVTHCTPKIASAPLQAGLSGDMGRISTFPWINYKNLFIICQCID